ncbi:hypothetical protein ACLB2K_043394 [Fragaria x ananassa]
MDDRRVEILDKPSITKTLVEIFHIEVGPSWMDDILAYKKDGTLATEKIAAQTLIAIMECKLYCQSLKFPHLKCITPEEGRDVLNMIHSGDSSNLNGYHSLENKAMCYGYFWPTMTTHAEDVAKGCFKCRQFATMPTTPLEPLSIIMGPWIGSMWGQDLIGPLLVVKSYFRYIIIGIDYTTKWIEAVPLVKINTHRVEKLIWKNICYRFGVPNTIITDNGAQFNDQELISWATEKELQLKFASVAHPQTNSQVEAANKKIKAMLRKKLDETKRLWAEKLPEVLWAIRTTPTRATLETPLCLTYGTKAVLTC